ncbi:MAG TPA: hypothetical protein ENO21_00200 [Firmicutes bacterium]|nr:hypothetical protein [Bacillota bacterium]
MRKFYERNYFLIRRLHSLSGIIPVGVFFLIHMFFNSRAAQSPEQYQWVPDTLDQVPYLWAIEIGGILLPILFHAVLGAVIIVQGDVNSQKPALSWYSNWAYTMQRVTGFFLFFFIAWHVYTAWWPHFSMRLQASMGGPHQEFEIFPHTQGLVSGPWGMTYYIIFVLFAAYHFGNGIYNFLYKWGATTSKTSQKYAIAVGLLIGLLGVIMGFSSLWGLTMSPWAREYLGEMARVALSAVGR